MATKTYKAKSVRISMQTTQNVLDTSPTWFTLPASSCNVTASESSEKIDIINGGGEPNATFLNGIDDITGNINFNLQYPLLAWLFGVSIGEATPVDTTSTDWTADTEFGILQQDHGCRRVVLVLSDWTADTGFCLLRQHHGCRRGFLVLTDWTADTGFGWLLQYH